MPPTDPHAADPHAADRFARSEPFAPADAFGPGPEPDPYADPDPYAPPAAAEPAAGPAPLPGPFLPAGGDWPTRAAWATAAGAVVCLGVWQFGLWEVELSDPPAGVLAGGGAAADPGEPAADAAALDWGRAWDPDAGLTADPAAAGGDAGDDAFALLADPPAPAGPADADADLWGDDPADTAAAPADPLGAVAFAPPPVPAAVPPAPAAPADPAGFWDEEPPAAAAVVTVAAAPGADPFAAGDPGEPADPFAAVRAAPAAPPVAGEDPFAPSVAPSVAATAAPPVAAPAPPAGDVVRVASASSADGAAVVPADRDDPFYPDADDPHAEPAAASAADALIAAVDAAVEAGEVLEAHTALSRLWWDVPADRPRVRGRLDGTARQIYFDAASHFMTPRTVAAGESLADVAADLAVPEMYLARVNGVAPASVTAGTALKVIRGPFGAACDLAGETLTVHAHGYYVRAFHCEAAGVAPGAYTVGGKAGAAADLALLLTPSEGGDPVRLSAADPTDASPGLGLSTLDAGQVFDLLKVGDSLVVRP